MLVGAVVTCLTLCVGLAPLSAVRARDAGVVWLFVIDDLHIDFRSTGLVRQWLASLCKQLVRDEDAFAMRTTGPSSVSVGLLAGLDDLNAAIRRISGAAL